MVAIQIRDVPEETRAALAAEAAERGVSLQVYLRRVLDEEARRHRNASWLAQIRSRVAGQETRAWEGPSMAELIRRDRERDEPGSA